MNFSSQISTYDLSPFGMQIQERSETFGAKGYKFGFNGMEQDDEVSGGGNSYTSHFRQLDTRLGRWFSVDPVLHEFFTPYNAFDNNPILISDPTGADGGIRRWGRRRGQVNATVYVQFDTDAGLTPAQQTAYINSLRTDIQNTWSTYTMPDGTPVNGSTANVLALPAGGRRLRRNENLVTVGAGANDASASGISHTDGKGIFTNTGYFYLSGGTGGVYGNEGSHEFGHFLGLADRYHEGVNVSNNFTLNFRGPTTPVRGWGNQYNSQTNLMSAPAGTPGSTLTNKQMRIVSNRFRFEFNKSRVVLVNDAQLANVVAVQAISILGIKIVTKYSANPVGMQNDVQDNAGEPTWGWKLQRGGSGRQNYFRGLLPNRSRAIRRQNNRLIRRISRM